MPPEIVTALIVAIAAFAGAALAQFASRKLTAANAEKFLAEAEKMRAESEKIRVEAEALRWQSEKAIAERQADKKALAEALDRLDESENQRKIAYEKNLAEKLREIDLYEARAKATARPTMSAAERSARDTAIAEYFEGERRRTKDLAEESE